MYIQDKGSTDPPNPAIGSKWDISQISQKGHFKNRKKVHIWYTVCPVGRIMGNQLSMGRMKATEPVPAFQQQSLNEISK
jgi:hypothetical protein